MGELKDKMIKDMELKNLSERTIETYLYCMKRFVIFHGKSPDKIDPNVIRDFLYYLLKEKGYGQATINQTYSALKFFYETTLGREWDRLKIPRSRREKKATCRIIHRRGIGCFRTNSESETPGHINDDLFRRVEAQ